MDELTTLLMEWIGIDPATNTLGGWGYASVAEFFIHHTSLTKQDTFKFTRNVKYQFTGMVGILSPVDKVKIIYAILDKYQANPGYPQRTRQLYDKIIYFFYELQKTEQEKLKEKYLKQLGMTSLTTFDDLKKNYKEQISRNHPDKVEHLSQDIKELAAQKTKEINEAYTFLKKII